MSSPAIFQGDGQTYHADSCEPLKAAAQRGVLDLYAWSRGSYPGLRWDEGELDEIRSIGIWDAPYHQAWGLDRHCNEGIEFTYLAKGQVIFGVDGKSWTLRKGYLTITRPWQFHYVGQPNITASRLYWLILDVNVRRPNQVWQWPDWLMLSEEELANLTNLLSHNEQPVWQANDSIARCFARLADLLETQQPQDSKTRLMLYINELLLSVMDMLQQKRIPLDMHLTTSLRAVEMFLDNLQHYIAYEWTLDEMARQCGLSRSQFSSYCKQITNMTPIEYLNFCRVDAGARMLLDDLERPITDIAYTCGFNSSQYFATVFRSFQGCSPRDYRLQHEGEGTPTLETNAIATEQR